MILASITFYMFAVITILSSFMVIFSRNPVHSVLFLILAFINVAGLFILLGAEFLAMILIIVYHLGVLVTDSMVNGFVLRIVEVEHVI